MIGDRGGIPDKGDCFDWCVTSSDEGLDFLLVAGGHEGDCFDWSWAHDSWVIPQANAVDLIGNP